MIDKIHKLYYSLPHDHKYGIFSKILNRLVAKALKRFFDNKTIRKENLNKIPNKEVSDESKRYIVSLTSFPARINDVWISIQSIFEQTVPPDAVILWLSKEQFEDVKIPHSLKILEKKGLTIKFVDGDIRSHKKYKYAIEQYPNDYIITLDDDLYYDNGLIENLIFLKKKYPHCIPTNRAHKVLVKNNQILPYNKWYHNVFNEMPSHALVQTGGFGTLYEASDLFHDFNNIEKIMKLAPHADDLWLKIMVLLNKKKIVTNDRYNKDPLTVKGTQFKKLVTQNVLEGGNDVQLQNLMKYYNLTPKDFQDA